MWQNSSGFALILKYENPWLFFWVISSYINLLFMNSSAVQKPEFHSPRFYQREFYLGRFYLHGYDLGAYVDKI